MIVECEGKQVVCPGCRRSTEKRRAYVEGETDFLICQHCGLVFRECLPSTSELASIYASHYEATNIVRGCTEQESGEFALTAYCQFLRRRLEPRLTRVLDYGAGTGRLVELFREAGFQADGLEFAHAARRHGLEYRGITLFARPAELPEGVYDLVTMIEVIEHLANLMEELMAIRKAMQRGGMLFVTTPNRVGLRARMEKGYWREARKKFHLFLFDRHSLKHILLRAGFSSVEVVHFSPVPKPGRLFWLYGRVCQCLRLGGTLCVTARR